MAAPKTANINITIGSTEYVVSHKNFSELKVSRTAKDVNDSFELSILDNDAYEIEGALLSGNNYIQIDYVDDDLKVYKSLGGFVFKLGSSFINNRNNLTVEQKIVNIFNSPNYIYKIDVVIVTDNNKVIKRIIGKNKNNLITMDNEYIPINTIRDIYIVR